jgi:hypothetical protein
MPLTGQRHSASQLGAWSTALVAAHLHQVDGEQVKGVGQDADTSQERLHADEQDRSKLFDAQPRSGWRDQRGACRWRTLNQGCIVQVLEDSQGHTLEIRQAEPLPFVVCAPLRALSAGCSDRAVSVRHSKSPHMRLGSRPRWCWRPHNELYRSACRDHGHFHFARRTDGVNETRAPQMVRPRTIFGKASWRCRPALLGNGAVTGGHHSIDVGYFPVRRGCGHWCPSD